MNLKYGSTKGENNLDDISIIVIKVIENEVE